MKFSAYIRNLFFPPRCAICGKMLGIASGSPLCIDCQYELSKESARLCKGCGLDQSSCTCLLPVLKPEGFLFHVKLYGYSATDRRSPANRLVYKMKSSQRSELYDDLACKLEKNVLSAVTTECSARSLTPVITYVPRSRSSVAKYGFDQAELLARALSRRLSIPTVIAVKRKHLTDAEMKSLNAAGRFTAGANAFEVNSRCGVGKNTLLIIVDDVITSGASVYWTAKTASSLGVTDFAVVSVAKTY